MTSLWQEFSDRGFIYQCSSQERFEELTQQPGQVAYCGFDCTASSFHVGNLAIIMLLRKWQQAGHKPIIVLGGGTTLIGDPSGKDKTRQVLSCEAIEANKQSLKRIFSILLDFDTNKSHCAIVLDNNEWLSQLNLLPFLRDVGPHLTLNRLLTFDSIKSRLQREQPLSYLEFNYMMMQAYDFFHLYGQHQVMFQFGGSDQWGNMISGLDLIRKKSQAQVCVMTIPLMVTKDGKKMGKSEQGAIWLDSNQLADFDYWQFWRNCHDDDVKKFLMIYTDLSHSKIQSLAQEHAHNPNALKEILANEATALVRGPQASQSSAQAASELFKGDIEVSKHENLPKITLSQDYDLAEHIVDLLVKKQVFISKSACRKMILQGGVKVDGSKLEDITLTLSDLSNFKESGQCLLSVGKKKHYLIQRL